MSDSALEQLQTKIAFLEGAVAELSDVMFSQHRDIQALRAELREMRERVSAAQLEATHTLPHELPPHY